MPGGRPRKSEVQSKAEALKKKRETEKLRREKIRNDPILYHEYKEKERERYHKRKEKGEIKTVDQLSNSALKRRRRAVRERVRKHRQNKTAIQNVLADTPPGTPSGDVSDQEDVLDVAHAIRPEPAHPQELPAPSGPRKRELWRKLELRTAEKLRRKLHKEMERSKKFKQSSNMFKKRWQRLKAVNEKMKREETPEMVAEGLINDNSLPGKKKLKEKLIFGEAMVKQLEEQYKSLSFSRQVFVKAVGGGTLKKYGCLMKAGQFFPYGTYRSNRKRNIKSLKYEKALKSSALKMEKKILQFLLDDEYSTQCPGKRDVICLANGKFQRRFLNDTLLKLHKQFCTKVEKISYATFCRLRPKYIVQAKVSDRDTCLCLKHENMKLVVRALKNSEILAASGPNELVTSVCCEPQTPACLLRTCKQCSTKKISFSSNANASEFKYKQWRTIEECRTFKGKEHRVKRVVKAEITERLEDVISNVQQDISVFMRHIYYIKHQCQEFRKLRDCGSTEMTLQIDFSENYCCKYGREPQSVHFGASRQQLSLHAGCAWTDKKIISFCTISENLRHDGKAVAAHLTMVLEYLLENFPSVIKLNIISDGPSGQYRNKTIFTFLGSVLPTIFPQILSMSWNYCEAGHGKGPADGIGGALKRSADQAVALHKDVNNLSSFLQVIENNNSKIKIFLVEGKHFEKMDKTLEHVMPPVKKTMQVHQVTWARDQNELHFNALSCTVCAWGTECVHWKVCDPMKLAEDCTDTSHHEVDEDMEVPVEAMAKEGQTYQPKAGSSKSTQHHPNVSTVFDFSHQEFDWVVAVYDDEWFPGIVEKVTGDNLKVNFMNRGTGYNNFYWPLPPDRQNLHKNGILYKLKEPPKSTSRRYMAVEEYKYIEFLKNNLTD